MLDGREDQASGLRRLFRRSPPAVVAMFAAGRTPQALAARTLMELARRAPGVAVLDETPGEGGLLEAFGVEPRGDLLHLIDGATQIGSLVSELGRDLTHLSVGGAALALPLLDDDRRDHLVTGLAEIQRRTQLMVVHGVQAEWSRPSPFVLAAPSRMLVIEASARGVTDGVAIIRQLAGAGAGDLAVAVAGARDRHEALALYGQLEALVRRQVGLPLRLIGELERDDLAARLQDQAPPRRERQASAAFLRRLSAWTRTQGMTGGHRA
ncbi:MAG: flagellar FleN [Rhodocyclaceae bacterium]|nr:flagellar FleN [Rhodocyclaceae bacterium]